MTSKELGKRDGFSPLMFMAAFLEIIAVILFLALVVDLYGGSPADQVPVFELIGLLVLFAWLTKKIDKVVCVVSDQLESFVRWFERDPRTGSPMQIKDLPKWHRRSFQIVRIAVPVIALPALTIGAMFYLAEGSPVTATIWKWAYLSAVSLMALCLAWMIGTLFHARRWRCTKNVENGSVHGE